MAPSSEVVMGIHDVTAERVHRDMAEFDALSRDAFSVKYSFKWTRGYLLARKILSDHGTTPSLLSQTL